MNKISFIPTKNNSYIHADKKNFCLFVPEAMKATLNSVGNSEYYNQKLRFWKENDLLSKDDITLQTEYSEELVRQNLACLRQLLIEVTDCCNLKCKYCGYGEFYSNYDKRNTRNQNFENVKILIDYLLELWTSEYNVSHENTVTIGFYGGEPLLNMKLVKETISYLESLKLQKLNFRYNMTTNALLLDKYMDYLVEKDFNLLFSLDGNEYNNSYRMDNCGNPSFIKVTNNIQKLKETYPDYFEKRVGFNTVLHNRNSVEESYRTIYGLFGKVPRVTELNTTGIVPKRLVEFAQIFKSSNESFNQAIKQPEIKEAFKAKDVKSNQFHSMLMQYSGNYHTSYSELFTKSDKVAYLPTSTCQPFERRLFLTVNGKILPCEKIGQEHSVGKLSNGKLELDCKFVAEYYSSLYRKVISNCHSCQLKKNCKQCLFTLQNKHEKLICLDITNEKKLTEMFSMFLSYAEEHPEDYEYLLSSIALE